VLDSSGTKERFRVRREEQTVARCSGSAAGSAESLQKRSHSRRGVDLDYAVEIANVDASSLV
jgi:hypothetical protein